MSNYISKEAALKSIAQFDIDCLKTARDNLVKPLNFYFGDNTQRRFVKRLETIVNKLDKLIDIAEEGRNVELQELYRGIHR